MSDARRHLYLTGYRGTGKSTLARQLSQRLGCPAFDLDDEIVAAEHRPIREIFETDGEPHFRELEVQHLARLAEGEASVIALGGGAILRPENQMLVRRTGWCVWLKASPATLHQRLTQDPRTADSRPALTQVSEQDEITRLLQQREPIYAAAADASWDTETESPHELALAVTTWFQRQHRS